MRIRKGPFSASVRLGGSSVSLNFGDVAAEPIPYLLDGGIEPSYTLGTGGTAAENTANATYAWNRFEEGGSDGFGMTISGNTTDSRIASMRIPARFITPYQAEADRTEYVDVIVPPYPGTNDADEENTFTVYFYLNGGSPVQGVKRTIDSGYAAGATVYSARVPKSLAHDVNEVRCVVMPAYGRPAILQVAGMLDSNKPTDFDGVIFDSQVDVENSWNIGFRGTLLVNYDQFDLSETYSTITQAVTQAGHSRILCDASSVYTSESPGDLFDIAWKVTDGSVKSDPYVVMPKVANGVFNPCNSDGGRQYVSIVARDCAFPPNPALARYRMVWKGNSSYRPFYCQFESCDFSLEKVTDYAGAAAATALGAAINAAGFGRLLDMYDRGKTSEDLAFYLTDNSGLGDFISFFGCTCKYISIIGQEHVGCSLYCPCPNEVDQIGRSKLVVKTNTYGSHKVLFPWGSIGADQITYDYDWEKIGTAAYTTLPNSGTLTPDASTVTAALNEMYASGVLSDASNLGVWPDWLPQEQSIDFDLFYLIKGTYVDHYNLQYLEWDKSWSNSLKTHMDFWQTLGTQSGYFIGAHCKAFGLQDSVQSLYHGNSVLESIAVWDFQATLSVTANVPLSIGVNTREGSAHYQVRDGNLVGSPSQFFGPGIHYVDADGTISSTQNLRSLIRGHPNVIRGFSYIGDSNYPTNATREAREYLIANATDDGISKVIQGVDDDGANGDVTDPAYDNEYTDNWWVVNLSR